MPEFNDNQGIKDKVHIVLRGPDGKIKDERVPEDTVEAEKAVGSALKAVAEEVRKHW